MGQTTFFKVIKCRNSNYGANEPTFTIGPVDLSLLSCRWCLCRPVGMGRGDVAYPSNAWSVVESPACVACSPPRRLVAATTRRTYRLHRMFRSRSFKWLSLTRRPSPTLRRPYLLPPCPCGPPLAGRHPAAWPVTHPRGVCGGRTCASADASH